MSGIYYRSEVGKTLRQGEIVTNLTQALLSIATLDTDFPEIENVVHPFAIVLSQDCDLDHDWKARQPSVAADANSKQRLLPAVLFAQMNTAVDLRARVGASDIWKRIRQNKDERYHFLEAVPPLEDRLESGLEELGIDFKRYFTLPTDEVYKRLEKGAQRRCRLVSPYLEHLSTRFCYYQFRVALPMDHQSV